MAKNIKSLTVFISSPSDVQPEREAVKVAIESTNRRQRSSDIRFEPWAWEDDAVSGIGSTPQDVIDRQTPEYDVYIGIMWKRFGTPTSRAGSGTEHEFRFALNSYRSKNMPSHVMFFSRLK